jgi:hypothetical protein
MSLFDAYIFVDWSAASGAQPQQPTADAVWVSEHTPGLDESSHESYHRTRNAGVVHVTSALERHVKDGRRVLVGFDFPYGYPEGLAPALALPSGGESWWMVWAELSDRIEDTIENVNNRFAVAGELNAIPSDAVAGPFWGCPTGTMVEKLDRCSPKFPFEARGNVLLQRLRMVEKRLPGVQETWKLLGAGSVGSQALVGIPHLYRLRRHVGLAAVSRVWPFETGFTPTPSPAQGPFILHAEI